MWLDYDLIQIHEKTFHHQANQWGDLTSKNNIRTSIYRKHFLSLDFIFQEFSENSVRRTRIKLKLKVFNVQQMPACESAYFVYSKVLKIFLEKKMRFYVLKFAENSLKHKYGRIYIYRSSRVEGLRKITILKVFGNFSKQYPRWI